MKNVFKIDNHLISLNRKDIQKSEFVIKSSPYNYTVNFIDDKTLRLVLLKNRKINKQKNFLFVDKNVDLMRWQWTLNEISTTSSVSPESDINILDKFFFCRRDSLGVRCFFPYFLHELIDLALDK